MARLSFETERTLLRPTSVEDAPFLFELMNTPKWLKYIGDRHIGSVLDAEEYVKVKMFPQLEKLGYSNYTVIRKIDKLKIGTCGLYDRDGMDGVDIGFAFLPQFEKQGFAFESAKRILQAGFEEFGLSEIKAITIIQNIDSQNLLQKLGLTFVENFNMENDIEDLLLYQISKKQFLTLHEI